MNPSGKKYHSVLEWFVPHERCTVFDSFLFSQKFFVRINNMAVIQLKLFYSFCIKVPFFQIEFFCPSLYQRALDFKIAPRFWCWWIFPSWRLLFLFPCDCLFKGFKKVIFFNFIRKEDMAASHILTVCERICIFMVSQRRALSTSVLFLYLLAILSFYF